MQRETLSQRMLAAMRGPRLKAAQTGGSDTGFEQAFASLAYTQLKDKAPRLLDSFVGFQLVDRDDDKTKAFGIMAFKPGDQWVYAPMFFLNGQLKGHELMLLKGPNQMLPLKENWVNFILGQKPSILGEVETKTLSQLGATQPSMFRLTMPPLGAKAGAAVTKWKAWAKEAFPHIVDLAITPPSQVEKYAGLDARLSLPRLLKENFALCKLAYSWMDQYPAFASAVHRFFGPDMLKEAVLAHRSRILGETRKTSLLRTPRDNADVIDRATSILSERKTQTSLATKSAVEVLLPGQETPLGITEKERERLLRQGYLVRDFRKEAETSKTYEVETRETLQNPAETKIYDVLTPRDGFLRCLVLTKPRSPSSLSGAAIVVSLSPRDWKAAKTSDVFVRAEERTIEGKDTSWFDSVPNDTVQEGGTYVIVLPSGDCSAPFTVVEKIDNDCYNVMYSYLGSSFAPQSTAFTCGYTAETQVVRTGKPGRRLTLTKTTVYVPDDAKFVRVVAAEDDDKSGYIFSQGKSFALGAAADLDTQIRRKTASLRVQIAGTEAVINSGKPLSKMAAMISLIREYGFREKDARRILAQAEKTAAINGGAANFRVKYAQGMPPAWIGPGPSSPVPEEPPMMSDPYVGQMIQTPQDQLLMAANTSTETADPNAYSLLPQHQRPDPGIMQAITQAAQTGQKEIFDTSAIVGLLRASRHDSLVGRYLGDLLKALDRLGRLIFVFYWHNDVFADKYGRAELPELEDALRNTFESLGDLILYLKEKDVSPLPGFLDGSPQLTDAAAAL